eukprot:2679222-Pleurochrysis_carterae.AAC.1
MPAVLTPSNPTFKKVPVFNFEFAAMVPDALRGANTCRSLHKIAGVTFWYKPDSSHRHLYPALKNANDLPVSTTVNGEETHAVCPSGIEIFKLATISAQITNT